MYISQASLTLALLIVPYNNVSSFLPQLHSPGKEITLKNNINNLLSTTTTATTATTTTSLYAKGTKKKKKKKTAGSSSSSSTGGFGAKVVSVKKKKKNDNDNDDYAAFPPLEDQVKSTLIPSDDNAKDISQAQDLSQDMYDRLGHIYGFKDFNYPVGWFDNDDDDDDADDDKKEEESMSLNDLLSTDDGSSSSSSSNTGSSSDFSDLLGTPSTSTPAPANSDFSDLISSVTGGNDTGATATTIATATTESTDSSSGYSTINTNISNLKPFTKFRVLHVDPMVLAVDDFFTEDECDKYVDLCKKPKKRTSSNDMPMMSRSKTMGKDSLAKAQRTSTTWFHHFKSVPEIVSKATRLMGLDTIGRWEEPQTVRYQQSEKFTWHLDALGPSDNLNDTGGQRVATLLVYLTDIGENNGGSTAFRDLGGDNEDYLKVQPKKGSALVFFPSAGGIANTPFDIRTLHAGEALSDDATEDKWIAQMWLREKTGYQASAPPGNSHADASDAIDSFCADK
jgi:hypothetical protein